MKDNLTFDEFLLRLSLANNIANDFIKISCLFSIPMTLLLIKYARGLLSDDNKH